MEAGRMRSGAALVAASALLFATKGVAVKLAYPYGVDALTLLALRYGLALPIYAVIWRREEGRARARGETPWTRGAYLRAALLGISGYWLASLLDFLGLRLIGVGLERMVLYIYPTLVVAIAVVWLRQAVGRVTLIALVMTYVGVALTYAGHAIGHADGHAHEPGQGAATALGVALVAGSAVAYAFFIVASGPALKKAGADGSQRLMAVAMTAASVVTLGQCLMVDGPGVLMHQPAAVWKIGGFLAIACTVLPTFLLAEGIRRIGSQRTAVIGAIGPVGTLLAAWLVLGETPSPAESVGMVMTIAAGVIMGLAPSPGKAAAASGTAAGQLAEGPAPTPAVTSR